MSKSDFILLFFAKRVLVLLTGFSADVFFVDGSTNETFSIPVKWYTDALETYSNIKWN
jgi:hypothetical protein